MSSTEPRINQASDETYSTYKYRDRFPAHGLLVDGKPAFTGIIPERAGEYVLLFVRDPLCAYDDDPATQLARRLENSEVIGRTGMFISWTGTYKGAHITAISGGSGGPEVELCMYELLEHTAATTFLRVGGSGGLSQHVIPGDLVISSGVVRADGVSASYVGPGWPAICSPELVMALVQAARALRVPYHVGLTRSSDSDLCGAGRPSVRGFLRPDQTDIIDECRRTRVLNGEREASTIVTMASLFGRRAGACCSVADNVAAGLTFQTGAGHQIAIEVALEGIAILSRMDRALETAGADCWLPTISLSDPPDAPR